MKQLQYITTVSLIVALTGLSAVVAADAGRSSEVESLQTDPVKSESTIEGALPQSVDEKKENIVLTAAEMDKVSAGGGLPSPGVIDWNPQIVSDPCEGGE